MRAHAFSSFTDSRKLATVHLLQLQAARALRNLIADRCQIHLYILN